MPRKKATQLKKNASGATAKNLNVTAFSAKDRRPLHLGFVNLGGDTRPVENKVYPIISAGNAALEKLPVPDTTYKRLQMDLYSFYIDHLPDFLGGTKEGLFKVSVNTRDPQNLSNPDNDAGVAVDFVGKDGQYATGFLFKGLLRNVIFNSWINLKFDLYELDTDADVYYDKIKSVISGVPELKNLDVLKGIPYLNLATKLFDGIIKTFGKNPDDHIWGELPILELVPTIGGAFLRSGIYVIFERRNSKKEDVTFENLQYKNNTLLIKGNAIKTLSNHLLFGVSIQEHKPIT